MPKVLILGGTTYDSIVRLDALPEPKPQTIHYAPFHETIGSTGAGKALPLTRLEVPVTLHSIIGEDDYGRRIAETLGAAGVDFLWDPDPAGTERHINLMDKNGGRISMFITQSSSRPPLDLSRLEKLIQGSDVIVLNIIAYTKTLIEMCLQSGKPVWTDLHDYDGENPYHKEYIEAADYIFMSSDNLSDYRTVMSSLVAGGKRLVVCTHGKRGATCLTGEGEWIEMPIIDEYKLEDANGAGDSFFAGFLYGFLQGRSSLECMRLAAVSAGLCVTSQELAYPGLGRELLEREAARHFS